MTKIKTNNQNSPYFRKKHGYIILPNYFLKNWVNVIGIGPSLLYLQLLTYCHKEKNIAWPTMDSLCQQMSIAKTTLLRYQNTLLKFGLIQNIKSGKFTASHFKNNIYHMTSLEQLPKYPYTKTILDSPGSKIQPTRFQNDTHMSSNLMFPMVSKCYSNNNKKNNINTTTKPVVNFTKRKEKGEEKMQEIRKRMLEFDFKTDFIEKILKEYPYEKIAEKLEMYAEGKEVRNPAGWFISALKNDYQIKRGQATFLDYNKNYTCKKSCLSPFNSQESNNQKFLSREESIKKIKLLRKKLKTMNSPYPVT